MGAVLQALAWSQDELMIQRLRRLYLCLNQSDVSFRHLTHFRADFLIKGRLNLGRNNQNGLKNTDLNLFFCLLVEFTDNCAFACQCRHLVVVNTSYILE